MTLVTLQMATMAARQILGFYDSIAATDQEAFTAGVVELLSIYPQAVLQRAVSPSRGIAAHVAYPNLARFKELLEGWHVEHVADMKRRGINTGWKPEDRSAPRLTGPGPEDAPDGAYANVHIPTGAPRYAAIVKWTETGDRRKWRYGVSSEGVAGIWVALDVWDQSQDRHMRRVSM